MPTLQPGDIVAADRLGSHKIAAAREAIEACGAQLNLLPAYSHERGDARHRHGGGSRADEAFRPSGKYEPGSDRGGAAVDVYEEEPATAASEPLVGLPNALCTPHLGYVEESVYATLYEAAIEQLLAYAPGAPINVVNAAPGG